MIPSYLAATATAADPTSDENHAIQPSIDTSSKRVDLVSPQQYPQTTHSKNYPFDELLEANKVFPSNNYRTLSKSELYQLIKNKTIYGLTFKSKPYALLFHDNGQAILQMDDGRHEVGTWSIKKNNDRVFIYSQRPTISDGGQHEVEYLLYTGKGAHHLLKVSPITRMSSSFVIRAGDTEKLLNHNSQSKNS